MTKKYGGRLVHCSRDEHGLIEVVEDRFERSLHFGTEPKQSAMDPSDPVRLVLSYTRAMVGALLFSGAPQRALLVGLGGGSLAKFLLHALPDCRVEAVEYREAVYDTARRCFALPEDPRLTVHLDDAVRHVARLPAKPTYDLILVDAFDAGGIDTSVCGSPFLEACRDLLTGGGVLAMNLWSADYLSVEDIAEQVSRCFGGPTLLLPVEGKDNIIGLVRRGGLDRRDLRHLGERAAELEAQTGIEFKALLKRLRKANGGLFR